MRFPSTSALALACGAVFLFPGCSGGTALTPSRGESPTSAATKTQQLLYVADSGTDTMDVFLYPKGTPEFTITGFYQVAGMCADTKGDVWLADYAENEMLEYAHGGRSPIAYLPDPNEYPSACSVDPTTGNLAVVSTFVDSPHGSSIAIYHHAQGSPTLYVDPGAFSLQSCGYDKRGDLFMDGASNSSSFVLAELLRGAKTIGNISLTGTVGAPGTVQWYGKYLAVGDNDYLGHPTAAIDQIQVSGSAGKIVSTTVLTGSAFTQQFTIAKTHGRRGKTIVAATNNNGSSSGVLFWKYPQGGAAIRTITGLVNPTGLAISP
jgi:hypothetical protein